MHAKLAEQVSVGGLNSQLRSGSCELFIGEFALLGPISMCYVLRFPDTLLLHQLTLFVQRWRVHEQRCKGKVAGNLQIAYWSHPDKNRITIDLTISGSRAAL